MEWTGERPGCADVARRALAAAWLCVCLSWGGAAHAQHSNGTCNIPTCNSVVAERFTWFGSRCSGCEVPLAIVSALTVAISVPTAMNGDTSVGLDGLTIFFGAGTASFAVYDAGKNVGHLGDGRWVMPVLGGVTGLAAIGIGVVGLVRHGRYEAAAAISCGTSGCKPGVPVPTVLPDGYDKPVMMVTVAAGVF